MIQVTAHYFLNAPTPLGASHVNVTLDILEMHMNHLVLVAIIINYDSSMDSVIVSRY